MFSNAELDFQVREDLLELRDSKEPPQIYVIATGGCSRMQSTLWSIPGASDYLVGAEFPYSQKATERVLGYRPDKFVSANTAMALAQVAYTHSLDSNRSQRHVGIGVTCSVASR